MPEYHCNIPVARPVIRRPKYRKDIWDAHIRLDVSGRSGWRRYRLALATITIPAASLTSSRSPCKWKQLQAKKEPRGCYSTPQACDRACLQGKGCVICLILWLQSPVIERPEDQPFPSQQRRRNADRTTSKLVVLWAKPYVSGETFNNYQRISRVATKDAGKQPQELALELETAQESTKSNVV